MSEKGVGRIESLFKNLHLRASTNKLIGGDNDNRSIKRCITESISNVNLPKASFLVLEGISQSRCHYLINYKTLLVQCEYRVSFGDVMRQVIDDFHHDSCVV